MQSSVSAMQICHIRGARLVPSADIPPIVRMLSNRIMPFLLLCTLLAGCGGLPAPLSRARQHPVALRFGMEVAPDAGRNPIDPPERFAGYHVGLDYEVLADEVEADVPVYAICNGKILYSGFAEGYGGVVVQRCKVENEDVTVLYGHVDTQGLIGEGIVAQGGDQIAVLAPPYSFWSGGNRKHLHLGVHRGEAIDMRGYVQGEHELTEFIDPRALLSRGAAGRTVDEFHVQETQKEYSSAAAGAQ